ncbi:hypothetical protein E3T31_11930 [Cryobacterium sp. TMS1-13-1]|nr:hypothetical protein E3T31_11930 [Cryobacterium sp. TMS1-13-1]
MPVSSDCGPKSIRMLMRSERETILSTDSNRRSKALPIVAGFVLLHVVCCGLILTLGVAGALGAVGAVLGNPWFIVAAGILVSVLVISVLRRRAGGKGFSGEDCCEPQRPPRSQESASRVSEDRS